MIHIHVLVSLTSLFQSKKKISRDHRNYSGQTIIKGGYVREGMYVKAFHKCKFVSRSLSFKSEIFYGASYIHTCIMNLKKLHLFLSSAFKNIYMFPIFIYICWVQSLI